MQAFGIILAIALKIRSLREKHERKAVQAIEREEDGNAI